MDNYFSGLCDINSWEEKEFAKIALDIFGNPELETTPKHRKVWEFARTIIALKRAGLLDSKAKGLSVAAGVERILFYLATKINKIVATDIYGIGDFASLEANREFLSNPKKFSHIEIPDNSLSVLEMDALNLRFKENTFDFAFSMSSVEHFGGVEGAAKSINEMARVVKPGGLVIVTTELSDSRRFTDQIFNKRRLIRLINSINIPLIDQINLDADFEKVFFQGEESKKIVTDFFKDDLNSLPHINLSVWGVNFTSCILVFRKEGEHKFFEDSDLDNQIEGIKKEYEAEGGFKFSPFKPTAREKIELFINKIEKRLFYKNL